MDLSQLLNSSLGENLIGSVASQLGMNQQEASSAVKIALPTILAGLTRNAQSPQGAESLNQALADSRHDGSLLDNLGSLLGGSTHEVANDGTKILGHIFGGQQPEVEQGIAKKTGINIQKIGPLLAILAPIVMAYIGKQKRQTNAGAGDLGDLLGGLLGGRQTQAQPQQRQSGGGLMDMLGGMLDKNNDGNIVDDLLGGFLGGRK